MLTEGDAVLGHPSLKKGKPSKGTKKDKRLKRNKGAVRHGVVKMMLSAGIRNQGEGYYN